MHDPNCPGYILTGPTHSATQEDTRVPCPVCEAEWDRKHSGVYVETDYEDWYVYGYFYPGEPARITRDPGNSYPGHGPTAEVGRVTCAGGRVVDERRVEEHLDALERALAEAAQAAY